ncbi:hypothetical protein TW95_gp1723 [Pandoravirus inopinatum]|uniref:Uncharacterized protein n=1 Tax=Pandoravirus inopinatum TaxID=1605721 RepID=A0A0B5JF43_9VIRU|nr:hypothetical protein TW95_gp1723 [Pandoravirus inopinatum]AJF98457.1 hypothetical protein [Pandoravirus inopinatum]
MANNSVIQGRILLSFPFFLDLQLRRATASAPEEKVDCGIGAHFGFFGVCGDWRGQAGTQQKKEGMDQQMRQRAGTTEKIKSGAGKHQVWLPAKSSVWRPLLVGSQPEKRTKEKEKPLLQSARGLFFWFLFLWIQLRTAGSEKRAAHRTSARMQKWRHKSLVRTALALGFR